MRTTALEKSLEFRESGTFQGHTVITVLTERGVEFKRSLRSGLAEAEEAVGFA